MTMSLDPDGLPFSDHDTRPYITQPSESESGSSSREHFPNGFYIETGRANTSREESGSTGRKDNTITVIEGPEYPGHHLLDVDVIYTDKTTRVLNKMGAERFSTHPKRTQRSASEHDRCKQKYLRMCKRLKVAPLSRFLKQIGQCQIDMSGEGVGCKGVHALCCALLNIEVKCMNLSDNDLGPKSLLYLSELLGKNIFVTELILCNNNINGEKIKLLGDMVATCPTLRKLDISGNKVSDEDCKHVANIITKTQEITELIMNHNQLREQGGMWIGEALGVNESIEHLDVSWNHLRGRGAECLALGLQKNKTLATLDVSWNGFAFQGCAALGLALKDNTTLTALDISNNRVHPPGLMELLKGLQENTALVKIRLGPNPITVICTTLILGTIVKNTQSEVRLLDLSGIVVDEEFENILQEHQLSHPDFIAFYESSLSVKDRLHQEHKRSGHKARIGNTVYNIDPLRILWYTKKNLRTIDLFNKIDQDSNARLSRDELRMLLEKENFKLSSSALDNIMNYLDADGDGEIDLQEFADAERRFKREAIAAASRVTNRDMMGIEGKVAGAPLDPGGLGGRFSTTYRPDLLVNNPESKTESGRKELSLLPPINNKMRLSQQSNLTSVANKQTNDPLPDIKAAK